MRYYPHPKSCDEASGWTAWNQRLVRYEQANRIERYRPACSWDPVSDLYPRWHASTTTLAPTSKLAITTLIGLGWLGGLAGAVNLGRTGGRFVMPFVLFVGVLSTAIAMALLAVLWKRGRIK